MKVGPRRERRWQWRSYGRITGINHESQAGAAVCGINNCQAVHGISYDCWAGMKIENYLDECWSDSYAFDPEQDTSDTIYSESDEFDDSVNDQDFIIENKNSSYPTWVIIRVYAAGVRMIIPDPSKDISDVIPPVPALPSLNRKRTSHNIFEDAMPNHKEESIMKHKRTLQCKVAWRYCIYVTVHATFYSLAIQIQWLSDEQSQLQRDIFKVNIYPCRLTENNGLFQCKCLSESSLKIKNTTQLVHGRKA